MKALPLWSPPGLCYETYIGFGEASEQTELASEQNCAYVVFEGFPERTMKALPLWGPPGFSYEALLGSARLVNKRSRPPSKTVRMLCLRASQEEQ